MGDSQGILGLKNRGRSLKKLKSDNGKSFPHYWHIKLQGYFMKSLAIELDLKETIYILFPLTIKRLIE